MRVDDLAVAISANYDVEGLAPQFLTRLQRPGPGMSVDDLGRISCPVLVVVADDDVVALDHAIPADRWGRPVLTGSTVDRPGARKRWMSAASGRVLDAHRRA